MTTEKKLIIIHFMCCLLRADDTASSPRVRDGTRGRRGSINVHHNVVFVEVQTDVVAGAHRPHRIHIGDREMHLAAGIGAHMQG